jgi:hypothetical protein
MGMDIQKKPDISTYGGWVGILKTEAARFENAPYTKLHGHTFRKTVILI